MYFKNYIFIDVPISLGFITFFYALSSLIR